MEALSQAKWKVHVARATAVMNRADSKASELTSGEWVEFLSLLIGATLQKQTAPWSDHLMNIGARCAAPPETPSAQHPGRSQKS